MRKPDRTQSIVPNENNRTVYLVADDFGKIGRAWRETDCETADVRDLLSGQYSTPLPLQDFTDRHEGRYRDVQLPLPMRLV